MVDLMKQIKFSAKTSFPRVDLCYLETMAAAVDTEAQRVSSHLRNLRGELDQSSARVYFPLEGLCLATKAAP